MSSSAAKREDLIAGGATVDITPDNVQFLFGYPHVARASTGVHDPLSSSALFLDDGRQKLLFVANDVIYVARDLAARVRRRIAQQCGIPADNVMLTATHTHSGPVTVELLTSQADPVVPKVDPRYLEKLEAGMVKAALCAVQSARPAELGVCTADGACVGTNRHDPLGPSDPEVPVLLVRDRADRGYLGAMLVCSMHPTVLHEDSTLVSGDFPAAARRCLQERLLGADCPVLWHTGPCGNQSPRHVTRANTFDEAARLGTLLGEAILARTGSIEWRSDVAIDGARATVDLPPRAMPPVATAEANLQAARQRLASLRASGAPRTEVRTAECDLFGAEESLVLARAAAEEKLAAALATILPAEVLAMRIGPWTFVGWPGECYVEYALEVKSRARQCYVISLANGELQGYIVMQQAVDAGWYEAGNALLDGPRAGRLLVETTLQLVNELDRRLVSPTQPDHAPGGRVDG